MTEDIESKVRGMLTMLVERYGLLANAPVTRAFGVVGHLFVMTLDDNERISRLIPVGSSVIPPETVLDYIRDEHRVRLDSRLILDGLGMDAQLTWCRSRDTRQLAISLIFPEPGHLLSRLSWEGFQRTVRELLIDMAIELSSSGFVLDVTKDDDPDVRFLEETMLIDHLAHGTGIGSSTSRGPQHPGVFAGIRESLMALGTLTLAWGTNVKAFVSRGFSGVASVTSGW